MKKIKDNICVTEEETLTTLKKNDNVSTTFQIPNELFIGNYIYALKKIS